MKSQIHIIFQSLRHTLDQRINLINQKQPVGKTPAHMRVPSGSGPLPPHTHQSECKYYSSGGKSHQANPYGKALWKIHTIHIQCLGQDTNRISRIMCLQTWLWVLLCRVKQLTCVIWPGWYVETAHWEKNPSWSASLSLLWSSVWALSLFAHLFFYYYFIRLRLGIAIKNIFYTKVTETDFTCFISNYDTLCLVSANVIGVIGLIGRSV